MLDLSATVRPNSRRILFVYNEAAQFVRLDLHELKKRYQVTELPVLSRLFNPARIWREVQAHDLVFGWFASWHTWLPIELAKRAGKPSLLIIGGYDLACMPEIDYGHQRGGLKKWVSRRAMRSAGLLVTNSRYSQEEAERNAGIDKERVHAVHHGVPDPFGALPTGPRARMALTVGHVNRSNLRRKGHEPFVRAAALLPDVEFVLAGKWKDDAITSLRQIASPNVTFTDRLSDEALHEYYRKAAVYVQPSLHEGFGLSVAEAMLAGCVPVTSGVGALPEVTGALGIRMASAEPTEIASAVRRALEVPDAVRASLRAHILDEFTMDHRRIRLEELIESLFMAGRTTRLPSTIPGSLG